jgi:glutamate-1-semialdehyde 2,1-aminomutase
MSRYKESESFLEKAESVIPLGSQTFSKSRTQYPIGVSPLFIDHAKGANVWDIDGNKYVDLVSSLAAVTVGHNSPNINKAVSRQLKKGVIFPLPGKLEYEVAELLCELVPSSEMVRFGKNGSDATSAAIRLARAYTGKDNVVVCGYHGWQDWYIGSTTRNKGVPDSVSDLTHSFEYNNLESLQKILGTDLEIACVIMEPMNQMYPDPGFLEEVRRLTSEKGIILIFDETITGFRYSRGGAQELFKITPDLSTFGKGIANGFPLSAVVGKREIMMEMENVFYSGTFAGELLSLAAAKQVLRMHLADEICPELVKNGEKLGKFTEEVIAEHEISDLVGLSGHPTWRFLNWSPSQNVSTSQLKTYFLQECFANGLLVLGTHNVTLAHTTPILNKIQKIYAKVFSKIGAASLKGDLEQQLKVKPLEPLFRVR